MKKIAIIGASGYTGAQITELIDKESGISVYGLYVSAASADAGKLLANLYPAWPQLSYPLQGLTDEAKQDIGTHADAVVLALDHHVSMELAAWFYQQGLAVFDLSGAYRFSDKSMYPKWYGFEHEYPQLISEAAYGLTDWHQSQIKHSRLIAVPGCYPTASLLALKPVADLLTNTRPVINAVSGVTGAGRKAQMNTSFVEVSLSAYGVLNHRHQPEIVTQLGHQVIFTPHLGNFKRGILATITAELKPGVSLADVESAYQCYQANPNVLVQHGIFPKLDEVVHSPRCHLGWQYDEHSHYLVVTSAIDNLMKGAASQGLECIKIHFNLNV
ncbi:N-acetyl-gamma-glutamyl-phosphate reductase [Shewanella sp. NIFS-20-20]|uniref:N-acetyl-gamma-glutamyl-phosphate reductase n=1 Tax=Shewanella sp. NIFS-20-20 TaxID=2853806 RepID=UPI001C43C058|nr:N-acetyl-gamma-glutamyl-phosphate reductase [Shewanella sp. NIFS-20-20]MBV7315381.1 N-acetyl-gamma-glutamyl-phosphate reductase [Shewanella sp. NIFS-20-20]